MRRRLHRLRRGDEPEFLLSPGVTVVFFLLHCTVRVVSLDFWGRDGESVEFYHQSFKFQFPYLGEQVFFVVDFDAFLFNQIIFAKVLQVSKIPKLTYRVPLL